MILSHSKVRKGKVIMSQVLILMVGIVLLTLPSCRHTVPVKLSVSDRHQQTLKDLTRKEYASKELDTLFANLSERSDKLCPMHFGDEEFDEQYAESFATGIRLKKPKKEKWFDRVVPSLLIGCFNFFEMNDKGVKGTFETISRLIPEKKECFSVGLMQPYFMHATLQCEKLTMLDINWRIQHAHFHITDLHFSGKFRDHENIEKVLQKVPVAWVARFDHKPKKRPQSINLNTFCIPEEQNACISAMIEFQKYYKTLGEIDFQLSFLHEADLYPKKTTTSIVYASNALDAAYTKAEDFNAMMNKFHKTLPVGKNIYMVYQAGTSTDIGIYRIFREQPDSEEVTVYTICRDDFRWSDVYVDKGKPFKIYFDKVSLNKKSARCTEKPAKTQEKN